MLTFSSYLFAGHTAPEQFLLPEALLLPKPNQALALELEYFHELPGHCWATTQGIKEPNLKE